MTEYQRLEFEELKTLEDLKDRSLIGKFVAVEGNLDRLDLEYRIDRLFTGEITGRFHLYSPAHLGYLGSIECCVNPGESIILPYPLPEEWTRTPILVRGEMVEFHRLDQKHYKLRVQNIIKPDHQKWRGLLSSCTFEKGELSLTGEGQLSLVVKKG